jgi:hypothetical protein
MDFTKYSDKKLKDWIELWEISPVTRSLNSIDTYIEALKESFKRFSDQSYLKISYFKYRPNSTIEEFNSWLREAQMMCDFMCD